MFSLQHPDSDAYYTIETSVSGRIRRIIYPKGEPRLGVQYIHDGMEMGHLDLREVTDLTETVQSLAESDGIWPSPQPKGIVSWIIEMLLGKR